MGGRGPTGRPPHMLPEDLPPTPQSTFPRELVALCATGRSRIIAVRARAGPQRFALTAAILRSIRGAGIVVASSPGADAYRRFFDAQSPALRARWTVLEGGNTEGGVGAVAHALSRAGDLISEPHREGSLSALWLPAHIVEALGLLPTDGTGLVVIDSWDGLLSEYLPDQPAAPHSCPTRETLEGILVRAFREYANAIVVVIVDSSSQSRIGDLSDGVVEVAVRDDVGVLTGSILVSQTDQGVPRRESVGFHLEGGVVRWHLNR